MLVILLAAVVFLFLAIGAAVFVVCGLVPPLRRFGLSAALWCAAWGPCMVAWILFGGLALVASGFAMQAAHEGNLNLPSLPKDISVGYIIAGVLAAVFVASVLAWLHQVVIHRMTFALFRIYASVISAGVGSVWGWSLGLWLASEEGVPHRIPLWCLGVVLLCAGFGYAGYRWARQLRGSAPTEFGLVTREEFDGAA